MATSAAASSSDIILARDFAPDLVTYGTRKQLNNGGGVVYMQYAGKPFLVQTPLMNVPFGISKWDGDNGQPDKYSLDLSFDGADCREPLRQFQAMLETIDRQVVEQAMANSQQWFKKRFPSVDVVEALYTPTLRHAKDRTTGEITNQYAPKFKMALPMRDGRFQFPVYDANRSVLDLMDVVAREGKGKGCRAQAIVTCSAVWIVGTKFGVTWKVRQLKLVEPVRLTGYAFQATEEDEELAPSASYGDTGSGESSARGVGAQGQAPLYEVIDDEDV